MHATTKPAEVQDRAGCTCICRTSGPRQMVDARQSGVHDDACRDCPIHAIINSTIRHSLPRIINNHRTMTARVLCTAGERSQEHRQREFFYQGKTILGSAAM